MKTNTVNNVSCLIAILLGGLALSSTAWATSYTFTELAPLSGGARSTAYGINNLGQVVGETGFNAPCFGCGGYTRATLWNGATATALWSVGNSHAWDINDMGQVVGEEQSGYDSNYINAPMWDSASGTRLNLTSGYSANRAYAINNLGQVAGNAYGSTPGNFSAIVWTGTVPTYLGSTIYARDINDAGHVAGNTGQGAAAIWNGRTVTVLGHLSGGYSIAEAINNAGQVVGRSLTASGYHATLWNDTTAIDLDMLGSNSSAFGINNSGHVVGYSIVGGAGAHAFLWDGASMTDLNSFLDAGTVSAGWILDGAYDINDKEQIVGGARNVITGQYSAFLLTPVPEPETYAMLLAGLCVVGAAARRRKQPKFQVSQEG